MDLTSSKPHIAIKVCPWIGAADASFILNGPQYPNPWLEDCLHMRGDCSIRAFD